MSTLGAKVRVLIPTTVGAVEILLLTEEDPAIGRSVACIGGSAQTADIDASYNAFVARATGVIERLFGHPCYRLDVSDRIDGGSSWQLGVLTAHALRAAGRLAGEHDQAATVVWATGSVRSVDLTVGAISHLSEKFAHSFERLEREIERGRSVAVAVPAANASDVAAEVRAKLASLKIDLIEVGSVETLWKRLNLAPATVREQLEQRRKLTLRTSIAAGMGALAIAAGVAAWIALRQSLEAERRLAVALEVTAGVTRMAEDLKETFGVTAPQLALRLNEADAALQRLSDPQSPGVSLSELARTLSRLSENVGDTPEFRHRKAQTLIALSENYGALGRTSEQLAHAIAARNLLTQLAAREDPDPQWRRDLGRAYITEGDALRSQGKSREALASYDASQRLRVTAQDAEGLKNLADTVARAGQIMAERGDYEEALKKFDEVLQIRQRLAAMQPNERIWRRGVAAALGNIADTLSKRGEPERALSRLRESERIMTEFAAADPDNARWLRELSVWQERIGDILLERPDLGDALAVYQTAMGQRRRLATGDPHNAQWQIDLFYSYSRMADVQTKSDLRGALATRREGHSRIAKLASGSEASADVRRALLISHMNLGDNLQQLADSEAASHYQAAWEQAQYLIALDNNNAEWRDDLAITIERLAANMATRGSIDEAIIKLELAARIRADLVVLDPGRRNWHRNLVAVLDMTSKVVEQKGDLDRALQFSRDALARAEELASGEPANRTYQRDVSLLHERVGTLLLTKGQNTAAIEHFERSRDILERGSETASHEWQWGLVTARMRLADAFLAAGQTDLTEDQLSQSKELAERLHRSDSANTAGIQALYTIYARVSAIEQTRGRPDLSLAALQRCQDLVVSLVARDPHNHAWRLDLALTHNGMGGVLASVPGRQEEALSSYREAVRLLEPLSTSESANRVLQHTLADAHQGVATLLAERGDSEGELKALGAGRTALRRVTTVSPGDTALMERLDWFERKYRQRISGKN